MEQLFDFAYGEKNRVNGDVLYFVYSEKRNIRGDILYFFGYRDNIRNRKGLILKDTGEEKCRIYKD